MQCVSDSRYCLIHGSFAASAVIRCIELCFNLAKVQEFPSSWVLGLSCGSTNLRQDPSLSMHFHPFFFIVPHCQDSATVTIVLKCWWFCLTVALWHELKGSFLSWSPALSQATDKPPDHHASGVVAPTVLHCTWIACRSPACSPAEFWIWSVSLWESSWVFCEAVAAVVLTMDRNYRKQRAHLACECEPMPDLAHEVWWGQVTATAAFKNRMWNRSGYCEYLNMQMKFNIPFSDPLRSIKILYISPLTSFVLANWRFHSHSSSSGARWRSWKASSKSMPRIRHKRLKTKAPQSEMIKWKQTRRNA